MKIVVSGSTGLIGSALTKALLRRDHDVVPLVRRRVAPGEHAIAWDPERATIDRAGLEAADAVIHLAGENVFGRWSPAKKQRIRDSRVQGTRLLCDALAGLRHRPATLLAASAIGYYGDRGDEPVTEESAPGEDFLAHVARDWEAAFALRMAFGTEGAAMLQSGQRVLPARLLASGFDFSFTEVELALRHLLAPSERAR